MGIDNTFSCDENLLKNKTLVFLLHVVKLELNLFEVTSFRLLVPEINENVQVLSTNFLKFH